MATSTSRAGSTPVVVSLIATVVLFGVAGWLVFHRQYVVDQLTVWQYSPSREIAELVDAAGMNDNGKFYFYSAEPVLDGTSEFNEECERQEENSAILGCYKVGKIYIYDVSDKRLAGIEEVTAAHEMLHAVYERLSDQERTQVNALIDKEYQKLLASDDQALQERMAYYERTEPGERDNELHSIIATEVSSINSDLEAHYSQYFSDRQKVVAHHDSYNSKFVELKKNSAQLKTDLEMLSDDINAMTEQYNADIATLNTAIEQFNTRAESGDFTTQAEFQSARDQLTDRIDELTKRRADIDIKIANYETKRKAYNENVDEENSLTRSLDSSLAPAPSI